MAQDGRGRNWTAEIYPESMPANYTEILDNLHISWAESPVHDFDVNPDGTLKKSHIHLIFCFEGNKSFDQVRDITKLLNAPIPLKLQSVRGMVRYFVHLDNPEKYPYKKSDIKVHGGFEIDEYFAPSTADYMRILRELEEFIRDNDIREFCDLAEFVSQMKDKDDWYYVMTSRNTLYLSQVIRSRKFKLRYEEDVP